MGTLVDQVATTQAEMTAANMAMARARATLSGATRRRIAAEHNGYRTLEASQREEAEARAAVEALVARVTETTEAARAAVQALDTARRAHQAARIQGAYAALGLDAEGDLLIAERQNGLHRGYWEVVSVKMDADGHRVMREQYSYAPSNPNEIILAPDTRDAYGTAVRLATYLGAADAAPEDSPEDSQDAACWQPAEVHWGSLGTATVAEAEAALRVYQIVIALARYCDAQRAAWRAEDLAD